MGDQELAAFVAELVAKGESPDVINAVIDQWDETPAAPKPSPRNNLERFQQEFAGVDVLGQPLIPAGAISSVARAAGPAIRSVGSKVLGFLSKPGVGATIGAAEGYRQGGDVTSTVLGGIAGATGSKQLARSARPVAAARPAVHPVAEQMSSQAPRLIDTLKDPAAFRAAVEQRIGAVPMPVASHAPAKTSSLADEVAKRIDWRSTDAVPIDAITRDVSRGGTILEAGESQIGISERLAQAMKKAATDPKAAMEAELLARALRQRMHIAEGAIRRK